MSDYITQLIVFEEEVETVLDDDELMDTVVNSLTIDQFDESLIVESRLREICPKKNLSEMDIIEVEKATRIAFEIIGFKPKNFKKIFQKTWESSEANMLCDFIYGVWLNGNE